MVLNTHKIKFIGIKPQRFEINMVYYNIDGFFLFGSGGISSTSFRTIVVSENEHPSDYKKVADWIDKIDPIDS